MDIIFDPYVPLDIRREGRTSDLIHLRLLSVGTLIELAFERDSTFGYLTVVEIAGEVVDGSPLSPLPEIPTSVVDHLQWSVTDEYESRFIECSIATPRISYNDRSLSILWKKPNELVAKKALGGFSLFVSNTGLAGLSLSGVTLEQYTMFLESSGVR